MPWSNSVLPRVLGLFVGLGVCVGAYLFFEAQKQKNIEKQKYGAYGDRLVELRSQLAGDVCNRAASRELAGILEELGQVEEAALALEPAIENCPFNLEFSEWSARLWQRTGKLQRGLARAQSIVKERPTSATGYGIRGSIRLDLGLNTQAIDDYRQVFELERGNLEAGRVRADALEAEGAPCDAADVLDQVLVSSPPATVERMRGRSARLRAQGKCPREYVENGKAVIPVEIDSDVLLVEVKINNRISATMVLDTGASTVTLTRSLATRLGVDLAEAEPYFVGTAGGAAAAYRIALAELRLGGARVKRVAAAVVPSMELGENIDGLLGNSFLAHFKVRVDASKKQVILESLE